MKTEILTEYINEHKKPYYCRKCGALLVKSMVPAEKYRVDSFGAGVTHPYHPYDRDTGKRQFVMKYTCPNKSFFTSHDDFMKEEIILISNYEERN